jgi:hypothetical protein
MRVDVKMRRGAFLLREGRRRDPPCMLYMCHPLARGSTLRGVHHERGALHRRGKGV